MAVTAVVGLVLSGIALPGAGAGQAAAAPAAAPEAATAAAELASRRLVVRWTDPRPTARAAALEALGARLVHDLGDIWVIELRGAPAARRAFESLSADRRVAGVETDRVVRTASADPGYDQQWGIENDGQRIQGIVGQRGLDTRALGAWRATLGDPEVVVAVVDSGVDVGHPDLAANIWRNPHEEASGRDDDGNGYVDDLTGWDFKNDDNSLFDDADGDSHGTELAGVIAAVADNDIGITGIAPGVRVMPVKFLENGSGAMSDGLAALRYAAAQGADVIVASWIGERDHPYLRDVLEGTRVLVVAPAGNDGRDLSHGATSYPASYTLANLVSVAAVENQGSLAAFSNRGARQVDLGAPGRDILTTDPSVDPVTGDELPGYAYVSGTSMAAAFTAGAAALALSVNPALPSYELADLIRRSSRAYHQVEGATISGGLLDAGRLLELAAEAGQPPACYDAPPADFTDVSRDSVHIRAIDCLAYREWAEGTGDGAYEPRAPVTRAAMATFLYRVATEAGTTVEDPPDAFTDDDGSVHEPSIDALAALGIVEGQGDGLYAPSEVVSRAQMATMLRRTYDVLLGDVPAPTRRWFDDTVDPHADAIDVVRDLGIASGSQPREFSPAEDVHRDQMATFLVALLDILARRSVIEPG